MQYQKNLQFRQYPLYYLGKDKVQKWIAYTLPQNILETYYPRIEYIPDIINTKCEQAGKPQLTMSMSIADFPFIYFMYFRLVIEIGIIRAAFVNSLKKTLLVFNFNSAHITKILKPFTLENFKTFSAIKFRDTLIQCRDDILKATIDEYSSSSKDFQLKWESSDRLFGELLSFWGFIVYINMYIKSHDDYDKEFKSMCLPKDGKEPEQSKETFLAENYFKSFFHVKPRTLIMYLYYKLSKLLKEIISNTPDCDIFKDCCVLYKDINLKGKQLLKDDDNPHDIFEFEKEQNSDYEITIEFRLFVCLLESTLFPPSSTHTNADLGNPLGGESYTVEGVKKYTIAILEFYKPLFKYYENQIDVEEEVVDANPTYTTSYKCKEPPKFDPTTQPYKKPGSFLSSWRPSWPSLPSLPSWLTGKFKSKKSKHKSIPKKTKHKSIPKKTKKSKHKSIPKKTKKSKHKSIPKKTKHKSITKKNKKSKSK